MTSNQAARQAKLRGVSLGKTVLGLLRKGLNASTPAQDKDGPVVFHLPAVASGRYNNSSEVVRPGLRILDAEEKSVAAGSFPPGTLRHLYTKTDNRAERRTAKASTLKVEAE